MRSKKSRKASMNKSVLGKLTIMILKRISEIIFKARNLRDVKLKMEERWQDI